ncbi:MAG: site-specific integrase [Gammaproteobacteria bacterium]|nr:site-specific integrase [Gammaproteobacteria bacterium]
MTNKINFTKAALNKLPVPPKGKRAYYYDAKTRGLGIAVTSAGTQTFILYRKINGKPERITLGHYPDISIEEARGLAYEALAAIARGENPNDRRRLARAEWTLKYLFAEYLERYAKTYKRSWQEDEAQFKRYLLPWQDRKLSAIHKKDVQSLHAKVGEKHGKYAANRMLALLRVVFAKAGEWGWDGQNPVTGVKQFSEQDRERFLLADELPRFFRALEEEPNHTARDYVLLSLLTGARRSNILAMRWRDINFENATWLIPATKNGTPQTVPLISEAMAILKQRETNCDGAEFVFPGTGKTGHLAEPKTAWQRILSRAGIENLRLHDLRRSMGSWQAATGANLSVIGKTLHHKDVASTMIYARLDLDPVRQAMETAAKAMLEAGSKNLDSEQIFNINTKE